VQNASAVYKNILLIISSHNNRHIICRKLFFSVVYTRLFVSCLVLWSLIFIFTFNTLILACTGNVFCCYFRVYAPRPGCMRWGNEGFTSLRRILSSLLPRLDNVSLSCT